MPNTDNAHAHAPIDAVRLGGVFEQTTIRLGRSRRCSTTVAMMAMVIGIDMLLLLLCSTVAHNRHAAVRGGYCDCRPSTIPQPRVVLPLNLASARRARPIDGEPLDEAWLTKLMLTDEPDDNLLVVITAAVGTVALHNILTAAVLILLLR